MEDMDRVIKLSVEVSGLRKRLAEAEAELALAVRVAGRSVQPPLPALDGAPRKIMAALEAAGGEASVKDLAAATGLDSRAVSSTLSREASRKGTVESPKRGVYRVVKKTE